jgi:N6-adenosine-specific RNA methylase IME4
MNPFAGIDGQSYGCILADPPWRFRNRTGKVAPEHRRLKRYASLSLEEIRGLPVGHLSSVRSHLWLWTPNAMLKEAIGTMEHWGWRYVTNIVWYKVRKDGGPDGRGCGFYMRNVTELLLLGVRGTLRTGPAGRRLPNVIITRKRDHSRKPDEVYPLLESLSPEPRIELFARGTPRPGWTCWGDQLDILGSSHLEETR